MNIYEGSKTPEGIPDGARAQIEARMRTAETTDTRYVKNCPFRLMRIANPCDKIPANFQCNTGDCWEMAMKMQGIDWRKISEQNMAEFKRAIGLVDYEAITRLLDEHLTNTMKNL